MTESRPFIGASISACHAVLVASRTSGILYFESVRRKTDSGRLWLAGSLILAFVLLSGALYQFSLAPGLRIRVDVAGAVEDAFVSQERRPNPLGGELIGWIVSVTTGLAIILFVVALLRRENRLSTIVAILLAAALAFLLANLVRNPERLLPSEDDVRLDAGDNGALGMIDPLDPEDAVEEHPARDAPPWVWTAAVLVPAVVGIYLVLRPYLKRSPRSGAADVGKVAADAADAIEAGEILLDVIQRCYRDMIATLEARSSVRRRDSMTPREFEERLKTEGFDLADVTALTLLFERSRYSVAPLSSADEYAAVAHLRSIAVKYGGTS